MSMRRITLMIVIAASASAAAAAAAERDPGAAIKLGWSEGDVAGLTTILSPDGAKPIGFVEYHQHRKGDRLEMVRVARFADGSSDEDQAEARIGPTLEALRGRSIIRNAHGAPTVDITIDVAGGHISGFYQDGDERENVDDRRALPPGTYWGPLIFIVLKNFDENADGDQLVFNTVAPTPKPRVLHMQLLRSGSTTLTRPGGRLDVVRYSLRPTINWLIDPIIQRIAPETSFFVDSGRPPALARFSGPRNYGGQMMRLE
jgi:hypothetical protein